MPEQSAESSLNFFLNVASSLTSPGSAAGTRAARILSLPLSLSQSLCQSQSPRSNGLILTNGNKNIRMTLATALPAKSMRVFLLSCPSCIGYVNNLINILFAAHLEAYSHAPLSGLSVRGIHQVEKMKLDFYLHFCTCSKHAPKGSSKMCSSSSG